MSLLHEILEWSRDRPAWRRDAVRRLVLKVDLDDDAIRALTDICHSANGLPDQHGYVPPSAQHVPERVPGSAPMPLASVFHRHRINALAERQTRAFEQNLTTVHAHHDLMGEVSEVLTWGSGTSTPAPMAGAAPTTHINSDKLIFVLIEQGIGVRKGTIEVLSVGTDGFGDLEPEA